MIRMRMRKNSGFALKELVIIVVIVASVVLMAAPSYRDYLIKAKVTDAITAFGVAKSQIAAEIKTLKSMPQSIYGIPLDSAEVVQGEATDLVEGYRFGGDVDADAYWFVARLKQGVLPGELPYRKREIHLGIVKNSSGEWEYHCGSWNSSFIDFKYLPAGCEATRVEDALVRT